VLPTDVADRSDDGVGEGDEANGGDGSASVEQVPDTERKMFVSKVATYDEEGGHVALKLLASALIKMTKTRTHPFEHPFANLENRHTIRFEKGEDPKIVWSTALRKLTQGQMDYVANPPKYLYAIEDLGRGADGRVWLTSTCTGRVCVLKFVNSYHPVDSKNLKEEFEMWKQVYPKLAKHVELGKWSGRFALTMPHFSDVPVGERLSCIDQIGITLHEKFKSNGLKHPDVKWRNIGQYRGDDNSKCIVVYDLARMSKGGSEDPGCWVEAALQYLRDTA
jgi:hypothetical protein